MKRNPLAPRHCIGLGYRQSGPSSPSGEVGYCCSLGSCTYIQAAAAAAAPEARGSSSTGPALPAVVVPENELGGKVHQASSQRSQFLSSCYAAW